MPLIPLLPLFHTINRQYFENSLAVNNQPLVKVRWSDNRLKTTAGFYKRKQINGLVDSPPISIIFAPFSTIANACSTAAFLSKYWPPSEKESGVTFKIPMINDCFLSLESQSLNCLIFMCYFFEIFLPDNMTLISDSSIVSCSSSSSAIKCNRSIFSSSIFLAVSCAFLIIDTTS